MLLLILLGRVASMQCRPTSYGLLLQSTDVARCVVCVFRTRTRVSCAKTASWRLRRALCTRSYNAVRSGRSVSRLSVRCLSAELPWVATCMVTLGLHIDVVCQPKVGHYPSKRHDIALRNFVHMSNAFTATPNRHTRKTTYIINVWVLIIQDNTV